MQCLHFSGLTRSLLSELLVLSSERVELGLQLPCCVGSDSVLLLSVLEVCIGCFGRILSFVALEDGGFDFLTEASDFHVLVVVGSKAKNSLGIELLSETPLFDGLGFDLSACLVVFCCHCFEGALKICFLSQQFPMLFLSVLVLGLLLVPLDFFVLIQLPITAPLTSFASESGTVLETGTVRG